MSFNPQDFLHFDKMITPTILKVVYYILMVLVMLAGVVTIFSGVFTRGAFLAGLFGGALMLTIGPIMVRVYCELMAVLFEIHKNLREINDRGRQRAGLAPAPQNYQQPPPPSAPGWQ